MSKTILIRPLLVFLTFIIIVVLLLMLIFGAFSGDDDGGKADDGAAKTEQADKPAEPAKPAAEADADADEPAKPAEPKKKNPIAAADLDIGDCIADALSTNGDVTTFESAECNKPHDGEVYTLIKLTGGDDAKYPGTDFVNGKGQRGCRARLRRQATVEAFRDPQLGFKFVYPTRLSWADGDREITCLATYKEPRTETLAQR